MIIWSVIVFILILGVLVLVHELGHFLLARIFKVGVDEFGVGFPPRIMARKKGDTWYSLNWIPIGGFVKIRGVVGGDQMDTPIGDDDSTITQTSSDDFGSRPIWQRFAILFGGIFMNIVLTAVLLAVGFMIGMPSQLGDVPESARVSDRSVAVIDVQSDAPVIDAGILPGDKIRSIDASSIESVDDVRSALEQVAIGDNVLVHLQRADDELELEITTMELPDTHTTGLGLVLTETGTVQLPWHIALWYGARQTGYMLQSIFMSLFEIISGVFTGNQSAVVGVAGPLGIASITHQATQLGFIYVLQFAAILSINLAVFNLFPFPALDGGRILFLAVEAIMRRPINKRIEALIHNLGFILLLLFVVAVTIHDVIQLF